MKLYYVGERNGMQGEERRTVTEGTTDEFL